MMKILTKNVKTVLLSVLCLVMLVSTFVATMLFTNKAHAVDENTQVWVDDFESFTQDEYLKHNGLYMVNLEDNVKAVADPTDAENTAIQIGKSSNHGLLQYRFTGSGYSNFIDGAPMVFSADYYISEEEAAKGFAFGVSFFDKDGAANSRVPYGIREDGTIEMGNSAVISAVKVPIGEWFTLVLYMDNFNYSDMYMITKDGIQAVGLGFAAIQPAWQARFRASGIFQWRIGIWKDAAVLVDNISFKYASSTSHLSMQTTEGEVGEAETFGWKFTAEKGKTRTMEITGLTDTQEVVDIKNNDVTSVGRHDIVALIKDSSVKLPYSDTIYYWRRINTIGQTVDMSGVKFESASFDYDGQPHKIEITGELPEGVEVSYVNNDQTEVGIYEVVAKFTVDTTVYASIPDMKATMTIAEDDTVTEVTVDKTSAWAGDVITSKGLNKNGEESQSEHTIQWFRGTAAIEGATSKTYTVTSADEGSQLKVVYTAGTLTISSANITVSRVLDEDFESYPAGTVVGPNDTHNPFQVGSNVSLVADPKDPENQVIKLKGTDLIQANNGFTNGFTWGMSKFKDGAFVISASLYLSESAAQAGGSLNFSLQHGSSGSTGTWPFSIQEGIIYVINEANKYSVVKCPVGEWFTLSYIVEAFDGAASLVMTKESGEVNHLYYGAKPIRNAVLNGFKTNGVQIVRIGVDNQEWLVDNFSIKYALDYSHLSMQASTGEAGTPTTFGWDYAYTGETRTMELIGLIEETQAVVQFANDVTNAGRHDIFAVIKDSAADTRKYSDTIYYWRRINVSKASYNMEGITFESATYDWEHDKTYNIVIGGELPQGLTVEYTCNGEPFTGTTVGGVFEITATFVSSDPTNYNVPEAKTATLTVNQRSYDMSNVTFENKTVTYNGEAQKIAVSDNLPDGVTVKYYIGSDEFTGATNVGTYTIVAKFEGSIDYMPIADKTAMLVIEKANYDMSGVTFEDKTVTYNGTAVEFVASNVPVGVTAKYYVEENEVTEFIDAGEYNVTVKFESSDANYNAPTQTKTAKLTINKADVDMTGIKFDDKTVYFDGNAQTLEVTGLPSYVSVEYKVNGETFNGTMEEGVFVVTAVFTLTNDNYNALTETTKTATLKVEKRAYDMNGISFDSATFVYDGQAKSLAISGTLPEGVEVNYIGNNKVTVGEYTVTAQFVGDLTYAPIDDMTATLTITKATIDMSGVTFADVSVEYDGEVHSITISGTLPQGVSVTYEGNAKSEVGEYTVTAKFELDDTTNYNTIADKTAKLTITEKASSAGCMSSVTASAGVAALITMFGATALIRKGKKD